MYNLIKKLLNLLIIGLNLILYINSAIINSEGYIGKPFEHSEGLIEPPMFKINIFIGGSIMKIINYSICIELAMNRILRFPVVCNIQDAEKVFVRLKNDSKNPTDDSYYAEALTLLRCAIDYNASLSGICSEFINRKPICRFCN